MTCDPYTPDETELIGCYAASMHEHAGEDYTTAKADAERGIAKIKADALREAARDMRAQVERATEHQRFTEHELVESGVEHVLNEYADRIEEEARG